MHFPKTCTPRSFPRANHDSVPRESCVSDPSRPVLYWRRTPAGGRTHGMMSKDSFEIESDIVGDRFAVTLARMPGESPPGQTPQVVYVLDPILTLAPTVAAA